MAVSTISQIEVTPVRRFITGPIFDATEILSLNSSAAPDEVISSFLVDVPDQPGSRPFFAGFQIDIDGVSATAPGIEYFGNFRIDASNIEVVDLNNTAGNLSEVQKEILRTVILDNLSVAPRPTEDPEESNQIEFTLGVLTLAAQDIKTIQFSVPLKEFDVQSEPIELTLPFFSINASSTTLDQFQTNVTSSQIVIDAGTVDITETAFTVQGNAATLPGSGWVTLNAEISSSVPNDEFVISGDRNVSVNEEVFRIITQTIVPKHLGSVDFGGSITSDEVSVFVGVETIASSETIRIQTAIVLDQTINTRLPVASVFVPTDGNGTLLIDDSSITNVAHSIAISQDRGGFDTSITVRFSPSGITSNRWNPVYENVLVFTNNYTDRTITININGPDRNVEGQNSSPLSETSTWDISDSLGNAITINVDSSLSSSSTRSFKQVRDIVQNTFPLLSMNILTYGDLTAVSDYNGHFEQMKSGGDAQEIGCYVWWKAAWVGKLQESLTPGGGSISHYFMSHRTTGARVETSTISGKNKTISDFIDQIRLDISGMCVDFNVDYISGWGDLPHMFIGGANQNGRIVGHDIYGALEGVLLDFESPDWDASNKTNFPSSLDPATASWLWIEPIIKSELTYHSPAPSNYVSPSLEAGLLIYDQLLDLSLFSTVQSLVSTINTGIANAQNSFVFSVAEISGDLGGIDPSAILPSIDTVNIYIAKPSLLQTAPFDVETGGNYTFSSTFALDASTIGTLINDVNNDDIFGNLVNITVQDEHEDRARNSLNLTSPVDVSDLVSVFAATVSYTEPLVVSFPFADYLANPAGVLLLYQDIVDAFDGESGNPYNLGFSYDLNNAQYPEARPSDIGKNTFSEDLSNRASEKSFLGTFETAQLGIGPSYILTVNYNIQFAGASDVGGGAEGIQVALGGFEKDNVFYPVSSPSTWFEPGYTTLFPIQFDVTDADTVYLLLRTRLNSEGSSFSIDPSAYAIQVDYSNGDPDPNIISYIPSSSPFDTVWTDDFGSGSFETPVVLAIDSPSAFFDVTINDLNINESSLVRVNDIPEQIDEFGFLAINRSNPNSSNSQRESTLAETFGLVLDAQGVWDILIAPEATLSKVDTNEDFSYLGQRFSRQPLDADDAWDMSFNNESAIPADVLSDLTLSAVPGQEQVWILRIGPGVKQYLLSQRASAAEGSLQGCSVDIDVFVQSRTYSDIQGVCRITIFTDYTCVFDLQLCDFFWNLTIPPDPDGVELIENNLVINYRNLIDCNVLSQIDRPDQDNIEIDMPLLIEVENIPTFNNGNALLLIKSKYNGNVQSFTRPTQYDDIQFENCETLGTNVPLISKLNKELVIDPMGQEITDPLDIQTALLNLDSYVWIQPRFQVPPVDINKEIGADEIVVVGIGYTFKNWNNGLRNDTFLIEVNLKLSSGLLSQPELEFSHKYYYNQDES